MKNLPVIFWALIFVTNVSAMDQPESATNCHCFQERSFNPQKKFAADKYILTTSFNSFIAVNFHISKRQIVMMKMKGGVDPDNLLIALFVARTEGVELDNLLAILENGGTWKQIFESDALQTAGDYQTVFKSIVDTGENTSEAAEIVNDQLLKEFFKISDLEIADLREKGANGREITLVYLLERYGKSKKTVSDIFTMRIIEEKSWGEIAASFGLTPKETGKLLQEQR